MKIADVMSKDVRSCSPDETLDCAARIMWEHDCGAVPVVDGRGQIIGMITDRDICMAAYTQHERLSEIRISAIGLKPVVTVRPDEAPRSAEQLMQQHQLRRVPVADGGRVVGILSINDLARCATRNPRELPADEIARTLAEISKPRRATAGSSAV